MSIHATERRANVKARVFVYLSTLTIAGTPDLLFEGQERAVGSEDPFIRYTLEWLPGRASGRISSTATAAEEVVQVVADLFWPEGTADAYAIDRAADDLLYNLHLMSLPFLDYSATPGSPSAVTGYPIRVLDPPTLTRLPTADHYDRRRVVAVARWFTSHT